MEYKYHELISGAGEVVILFEDLKFESNGTRFYGSDETKQISFTVLAASLLILYKDKIGVTVIFI